MAAKRVLTAAAAREFQRDSASITLSSFVAIESAAAQALAESDCRWLCLDGLIDLSAEAAEALSTFRGQALTFGRLTKLSDSSARALSEFRGNLVLSGLRELSKSVANSLSTTTGSLYLNGLQKLSSAAAESLSTHPQLCLEVVGKSDADLPDDVIKVLKSAQRRQVVRSFVNDHGLASVEAFGLGLAVGSRHCHDVTTKWKTMTRRSGRFVPRSSRQPTEIEIETRSNEAGVSTSGPANALGDFEFSWTNPSPGPNAHRRWHVGSGRSFVCRTESC